jgi:cytochrome c biogenesis protein CcdA
MDNEKRALLENVICLILAGVGTFILWKYLVITLMQLLNIEYSTLTKWIIWIIIYLMGFGLLSLMLQKQRVLDMSEKVLAKKVKKV